MGTLLGDEGRMQMQRMQMDYSMNNNSGEENNEGGMFRIEVSRGDEREIFDIEASDREEAVKVAENKFVEKYGKNTLLSKCKIHNV